MSPQVVERLEKTLARVAKEQGLAQERLRRWVSFLALCGVLERAVAEGLLDGYDLKGGVALELRFSASVASGRSGCWHFRMPWRWDSTISPFS
jgi:hypothetical protein